MSPRGRRASLLPADHSRPESLAHDSLVVYHYDSEHRVKEYDFSTLPIGEPMQRSLAALLAAQCTPHRWGVHGTSKTHWMAVKKFATFLSRQEHPPRDLDELSASLVKRWRTDPGVGYPVITAISTLLRRDPRLQTGLVADELAVRVRQPKSKTQSYSEAEFDQIKAAARRTFRAALLRINENAGHLDRWREVSFAKGSEDWVVGEALDVLARTGDLPYQVGPSGRRSLSRKYRTALGGTRAGVTWQRLFLSSTEATALGVLLMAEYGWNLSVIDRAEVPRAAPDQGEDGHLTYRIALEKRRRGAGHHHETRNVTDDGASSPGRLITEALAATRFARAVVEDLAPGTNRLVVWHTSIGIREVSSTDRPLPVGLFHFGVPPTAARLWGRREGFGGSPFRRGRRTVNALDRREPGQNSQDTHDRDYVLVDKRVQADAVEIIAAGAEDAANRARKAVLVAQLRDGPTTEDVETATADCRDYGNSPYPAAVGGGCGASFLMCLGCGNARVHPGHHSRLAHLHHALANLRSVLAPSVWEAEWGDTHDRLDDLKHKLGNGVWTQALTGVTNSDRELIDHLLTGDLDT